MGPEFLIVMGVLAVAALVYWGVLTWLLGNVEIISQEPPDPQSIRERTQGRVLHVGNRFVTEQQLLQEIRQKHQRVVSGRTPTTPRTPAA